MPTPQATVPSAPQTPAPNAGFFIPQNTAAPTRNLSESPVLSSPSPKSASLSGTAPNNQTAKPSSKKKMMIAAGVVIAVLVLIGGGAGLYLTRTNEDTRQQASTPSGSAQVSLSPAAGTLKGGVAQQINMSLNLTTTPVTLSNIEISVQMTGNVPSDVVFQPQQLPNFLPADASFTDSDTGKTLKIIFKAASTQGFSASTSKVSLGNLKFTNPVSGQLNLRFTASDSKVLLQQSNVDILLPPSLVAYTFQSAATPTVALDNQVVNQASSSGNTVATRSASTNPPPSEPLGTGGGTDLETPTPIPTLLAQANTTPTPTKTPTPITTKTPTPTSARQNSQPADTQDKPVSGSEDLTLLLIGSGAAFMLSGFYLLPRKKAHLTPDNSQ